MPNVVSTHLRIAGEPAMLDEIKAKLDAATETKDGAFGHFYLRFDKLDPDYHWGDHQDWLGMEEILGPVSKPLTLPKVRQVIATYLKRGVRLHRKYGDVPELGMSSYNLADRLKRNFSVTLTELVREVETPRVG